MGMNKRNCTRDMEFGIRDFGYGILYRGLGRVAKNISLHGNPESSANISPGIV